MARKYIEKLELNEDQKKCTEALDEFFASDRRYFTLQGHAGRGKSTVLQQYFAEQDEKGWYVPSDIMAIAISHQARLILKNSIENSKSYASAVGMTQQLSSKNKDIDGLAGVEFKQRSGFEFSPACKELKKTKRFIFDECSMVDYQHLTPIEKYAKKGFKMILSGDPAQLPMIGGDPDADSSLFDIPGFKLTVPVRQREDDEIFQLGEKVIAMIKGEAPVDFKSLDRYRMNNGKGYSFTSEEKAIQSYLNAFRAGEDSVMVTFRNSKRKYLNETIRKELWGERECWDFVEGDYIIGTNQFSPGGTWKQTKNGPIFAQFGDPVFYNGQRMMIEDVREKQVKMLSKRFTTFFNLDGHEYRDVDQVFKLLGDGIRVWNLKVKGIKKRINVVQSRDKFKFFSVLRVLNILRDSTGNIGITSQFSSQFASVDFAYGATAYSCQGMTTRKCYTDMTDINECKPLTRKRKLQALYVAFSRPTHNLAIF